MPSKEKLYCNIVRILMEDADPQLKDRHRSRVDAGADPRGLHRQRKKMLFVFPDRFSTSAALVGVGAPTHVFYRISVRDWGAKQPSCRNILK